MLIMESILNTIDCINEANYLLNKFLSSSAWSSLSTRIFLQKALSDDLISVYTFSISKGSSFQELQNILLAKPFSATCIFPFQNL